MHYDDLIVGAGLYGCVMAYEMYRMGRRCLVIDARPHAGGNAYTSETRGIQVHEYGAHIFHTTDQEVWEYVHRFAQFNHFVNAPLALFKDELYNLPFNMNTFHRLWGVITPKEAEERVKAQSEEAIRELLCVRLKARPESITKEQIDSFEAENLEEQGLSLAGRDLFNRLIRGYTEKQWGRACKELPAFILQRVPFRFTYDNNYFNDPFQGVPIGGYTRMCERMLRMLPNGRDANSLETDGVLDVKLNTPYEEFVSLSEAGLPAQDKTDRTKPYRAVNGDTFSNIVFTGRIDTFFDYKFGTLEYRSLKFEKEDMPDTDNYQGNAVVNYTAPDVPYTRIIEHKHFEFGKGTGTVITREYPDTYEKGKEPYYPVNDEKNNALYARYLSYAKDFPRISFGGRLGSYQYYNMDQVVRAALDAAAHV